MIQRVQSLWIFLSIVCMVLCTYIPMGNVITPNSEGGSILKPVLANYDILVTILVATTIVTAAFALFLYKKRTVQKVLCLMGVLFSISTFTYIFINIKNLGSTTATLNFGIALPLVAAVLFILAYFGVRKDEKLIKSLDRLR